MKWTPEAVAELRELAGSGMGWRKVGERLGISHEGARRAAIALGIHERPDHSVWRARWESYLPGMKAALVADILEAGR